MAMGGKHTRSEGFGISWGIGENIFFHPLIIWLLTCFFTYTIGAVLIASLFDGVFLGGPGVVERLFQQEGLCRGSSNSVGWSTVVCRIFAPPSVVVVYYIPLLVLSLLLWLVFSINAQRIVWYVSRPQRWELILTMCAFLLLLLLLNLQRLDEYALFSGPIHGFHPLLPVLVSFCNFITPLAVWFIIDRIGRPHSLPGDD